MLKHSDMLIEILENKVNRSVFNIEPLVHRCVLDIINGIILGIETDCQNETFESLVRILKRMYTIVHLKMIKIWLQVDWIFRLTEYCSVEVDGKNIIHGHIKHAMAKAKQTNNNSALHFLLNLQEQHPEFANESELIHHLTTLFTASEDTITSICSFILVLFGIYNDIQEKVLNELKTFVVEEQFTINDLNKLTYLDMCIKDALRLFPIAPFIVRTTSSKCKIGDIDIPKNCSIIVSIYNLHTNPNFWERPKDFYPDHFKTNQIEKRPQYAYLPFSAGLRSCIGKGLAQLAMKTILVKALRKYKFETNATMSKELKCDISVRFKDDFYPINIKLR